MSKKYLLFTYAEGTTLVFLILLAGYLKTHLVLVDIIDVLFILAMPFLVLFLNLVVLPLQIRKYSASKVGGLMGSIAIMASFEEGLGLSLSFLLGVVSYFLFMICLDQINKGFFPDFPEQKAQK